MAKPSIFSKDYERKMKKRKIKITIGVILAAIITGILIYKLKIEDMDFSNVRSKLQAWVDSDSTNNNNKPETPKEIVEEAPPKQEEVKEEAPKKKELEVKLSKNDTIKCEYEEKDNKKEFIGIEDKKGISYDISPDKQMILVLDKDQNLKIIDIDGKIKDITRKEYISTKREKYPKDVMLNKYKGYIWHSQAKFIDNENIAYVSNLPYFGSAAKKQYIWIYNLKNETQKIVPKSGGKNIEFGKVVDKKGIEVKIDKTEYILNNKGGILSDNTSK